MCGTLLTSKPHQTVSCSGMGAFSLSPIEAILFCTSLVSHALSLSLSVPE